MSKKIQVITYIKDDSKINNSNIKLLATNLNKKVSSKIKSSIVLNRHNDQQTIASELAGHSKIFKFGQNGNDPFNIFWHFIVCCQKTCFHILREKVVVNVLYCLYFRFHSQT